jgi:hypothetical protein
MDEPVGVAGVLPRVNPLGPEGNIVEFRSWMLQTAFEYIWLARVAYERGLEAPPMPLAAFGLEVLFKSFNAVTDGPVGGIGELYRCQRGHNLLTLFDAIPERIRERFGWDVYRADFEGEVANLFVQARYPYERDAQSGGCMAIIERAEEMVRQVIRAYRDAGCRDRWVLGHSNV